MRSCRDSRSVVVGVDGSPSALRAVRWAAGVAVRDGVPLRLVHVYEHVSGLPRGRDRIDDAAAVVARVDPALPVEVVLEAAPLAETLLRESATASMLVLGTRRLSTFSGLLVGSVTVTVAGHADCPVVVVHGADQDVAPRETGPVVVGVDATAASESALSFAFAEAAVRGAELLAVHAWIEPVVVAGGRPPDLAAFRREAGKVLAGRLEGWQDKYPGVRVLRDVMHDRPGGALSHHSHNAQLVVVGRRDGDAVPGLVLGSTSQYLLHHARCPVVVTGTT